MLIKKRDGGEGGWLGTVAYLFFSPKQSFYVALAILNSLSRQAGLQLLDRIKKCTPPWQADLCELQDCVASSRLAKAIL